MSAEKAWQEELAYLEKWSAIFEEIKAEYDERNLGSHNPPVTFGDFVNLLLSLGIPTVQKMDVTEVLDFMEKHRCPDCGKLMTKKQGCFECNNRKCFVVKVMKSGEVVRAAAL